MKQSNPFYHFYFCHQRVQSCPPLCCFNCQLSSLSSPCLGLQWPERREETSAMDLRPLLLPGMGWGWVVRGLLTSLLSLSWQEAYIIVGPLIQTTFCLSLIKARLSGQQNGLLCHIWSYNRRAITADKILQWFWLSLLVLPCGKLIEGLFLNYVGSHALRWLGRSGVEVRFLLEHSCFFRKIAHKIAVWM